MSRRILTPAFLLVAAVCALAAVFAVQHIERRGGPLSEPYATPFISPGTSGAVTAAKIRYRTRERERVRIVVRDPRGRTVRTVQPYTEVPSGTSTASWDGRDSSGTVLPDGSYSVVITRAGDDREYEPAQPTVIDSAAPRAQLDGAQLDDHRLLGLVFTDPGSQVEATDVSTGDALYTRTTVPVAAARRTPRFITPRRGSAALRFTVSLGTEVAPTDVRISIVDQAGNRTRLPVAEVVAAERRVHAAGGRP